MEKRLRELASMLDGIAHDITLDLNSKIEGETVAGINVILWNYDEVVAGYVELAGEYFFSPSLVKLHGEVVEVRGFECNDVANVFDLEGNFICRVEAEDIPEKIREEKERRKNQLPLLLCEIFCPPWARVPREKSDSFSEDNERTLQKSQVAESVEEVQPLYGKYKDEHKCKNEREDNICLANPDFSTHKDSEKKCKSKSLCEFPLNLCERNESTSFLLGILDNNLRNRHVFRAYLLEPLIRFYLGLSHTSEVQDRLNQFFLALYSSPCGNYTRLCRVLSTLLEEFANSNPEFVKEVHRLASRISSLQGYFSIRNFSQLLEEIEKLLKTKQNKEEV